MSVGSLLGILGRGCETATVGAFKEQGRPRPEFLLGARAPLLLGSCATSRLMQVYKHAAVVLLLTTLPLHAEWPMHRGNSQLQGVADAAAPAKAELAWT